MMHEHIAAFFWLAGWFSIGIISFIFSLRHHMGTQIIELEDQGLRFRKKFLFFRYSRAIPASKIASLSTKELAPYNLLTGRDVKMDRKFGRLVVNNDPGYVYSFLYSIEELEAFRKEFTAMTALAAD